MGFFEQLKTDLDAMEDGGEKREMPEGLVRQTAECRHCGQGHLIATLDGWEEEKLLAEAARICRCAEATAAREGEAQKAAAKENVRLLFGDHDEHGEKLPAPSPWVMGGNIIAALDIAIDEIAAGNMVKITVDNGEGIKAVVQMTAKGMKVDRKEGYTFTRMG